MKKQCIIKDCNKSKLSKDYCRKHYRRFKKWGSPYAIYSSHGKPKHNMTGTKVYNTWRRIRQRVMNENATGYKNYGERGIDICERWEKFENFYKDMGDPPTKKHSIDRINNNKGYFPDNCRWATPHQQAINKRNPNNNQFGLMGVYQTRGYIYSMIAVNKKRIFLGQFKTPEEAHKAYMKAKKKYHATT